MKKNIMTLLVCMILCSCIIRPNVTERSDSVAIKQGLYMGNQQDLHVYLLIGQSNMAGRAPLLAEQYNVLENTLLLDAKGQWQLATNPLNRYSSIRKNLVMQKLGVGYSFANTLLQDLSKRQPQVKIGLVVNAKGGSSISEWQPDKHFYQQALQRVRQAQQTGTLKGILWHQGETDFEDTDYLNKLVSLVNNLRADLNLPELPFVAGQINQTELINQQIAQLPKQLKFTDFVSAKNLTAMDRWHFDNDSMLLLGEGYAKKMMKIQ
ncbi:sialate O-acetylesterase [Paraglaciecola sp. L3A3]|uniref:sialate O-acetylesterase n=1 Tax=Paraglaciecola sp. L3A3 TaxID=2686358 RepID=UPI00131E5679|nr:sialate O-acetylesterase [Paraglaciecola sp. L3A3]